MARHRNFEYQGFYAAELQAAKQEARKFTQVTGLPFTIDNARHALLNAADTAMIFFHNDCETPHCGKFKKQFNDISNSLPRGLLQEISELIETEVFAHLRLNYGDLAVAWLTDKIQTAARFMKVADRFSNLPTSANFNSSQMFEMLALPAGKLLPHKELD